MTNPSSTEEERPQPPQVIGFPITVGKRAEAKVVDHYCLISQDPATVKPDDWVEVEWDYRSS